MLSLWTMVLSFAAIVSLPETAENPAGLTRQQARTLSPRDIARITLNDLAEQVQEVARPIRQGAPYPDDRLKFLSFAFAPEAAGPGLCSARVINVSYESDAPESANGESLPVRPSHISVHSVYRLAGDFNWDGEWQTEDRARQLARCRQAGPVLTSDTGGTSRPAYFFFDGALDIRPAVVAVQRASAEARAGTATDLQCAGPHFVFDPCRDPRVVLRPVTLDDLTNIDSEAIGPSLYRVKAHFRDPAHRDREITLGLQIDVETAAAHRVVRIGPMRVSRFVVMWD
ncbi:MAG TPA: hypothetical protein VEC11_08305 [Allosphingosinicella sp.]|nr:hypothetical protein [Allosphingosinicella sp.]